MKITAGFANPFLVTIYTVTLLMVGTVAGAHCGTTLSAGWTLLFMSSLVPLNDCALAALVAFSATMSTSSSGK